MYNISELTDLPEGEMKALCKEQETLEIQISAKVAELEEELRKTRFEHRKISRYLDKIHLVCKTREDKNDEISSKIEDCLRILSQISKDFGKKNVTFQSVGKK